MLVRVRAEAGMDVSYRPRRSPVGGSKWDLLIRKTNSPAA